MARQAFAVNEAVRERVRHLAGVGVCQDDIARIIGCAPKTLRKRLRDDLDRGVAEANATIAGCLRTPADICIYGVAAGGGKTVGLILEPLRFVSRVSGFTAVFFRRTTPQ